ncbi:MAG: sigma-70 family RNA polymerase sigma factor [Clostridia bacterium]|nr:sigma-70 family RNA polymerase sigma factor [Clostridia bacterium]
MPKYRIKRYIANTKGKEKRIEAAIKHFNRKDRYMEHDLKRETMVVDMEKERVIFYPSREDSFERLSENNVQFEGGRSAEDKVLERIMIEKLWQEISKLPKTEKKILLLAALDGKSQKEIAEKLGINQSSVSRKLKTIREKLKKKMKNYL